MPNTGHMYYIHEEDIVFRRCQCDVLGIKEDEVTIFLAATLLLKSPQGDGVKVMHPEEGSDCNRVWDPDEENH